MSFCYKCGSKIGENATFCVKCGANVVESVNQQHLKSEERTTTVPNESIIYKNDTMKNVRESNSSYAIAALVLGIMSMITWILPIIGAPIGIVGLIFGIKGRKNFKKSIATAGMILSIVGLIATVINGSIGAYKGFSSALNKGLNTTSKSSTLFEPKSSLGKVVFCEKVDEDFNPVNAATTFSPGEVYVQIVSKSAFKTTKIKVTIYTVEGNQESIFDSAEEKANENWNTLAVPITFSVAGKYKVRFTRESDGASLGEGTVNIQNE